jgi:hypothetical protein
MDIQDPELNEAIRLRLQASKDQRSVDELQDHDDEESEDDEHFQGISLSDADCESEDGSEAASLPEHACPAVLEVRWEAWEDKVELDRRPRPRGNAAIAASTSTFGRGCVSQIEQHMEKHFAPTMPTVSPARQTPHLEKLCDRSPHDCQTSSATRDDRQPNGLDSNAEGMANSQNTESMESTVGPRGVRSSVRGKRTTQDSSIWSCSLHLC